MIPIAIDCPCGQRYEFEIEPVDGQMPSTVACPTCGADGTDAANAFLAQMVVEQPTAPAAAGRLRVQSEAPASKRRVPGRVDRNHAMQEARTKIIWGESPAQVIAFLVIQGWDRADAEEFVGDLFRERVGTVRRNGIAKIITGIGLLSIPVIVCIMTMASRVISVYGLMAAVVAGATGLWLLVSGIHMLVAPKSHSGSTEE